MPLRTILLRVMLWSLAISAVIGVIAVLTQGGRLGWKVIGTGFLTALACGLMLLTSRLIDREKSRSAGLLGVAGVVAEFILVASLIWEVPHVLWGRWFEGRIVETAGFLGIAVLVIMPLLRARYAPIAAVAAGMGVGAALAAFIAVEVSILTYHAPYYDLSRDWRETAGVIALFGGLAAVCLVGFGAGDRRHWRWAGIGAGVVAAAMWLTHIWMGIGSDLGEVIFSVLLSAAVVVAHANLCLLFVLPPHQGWVPTTAVGAAMVTTALLDLLVIDDKLYPVGVDIEVLRRPAAAAAIVAGCATLAVLVLTRMNRRIDFVSLSTELTEMTVICPRCGKKQAIRVGGAICSACKLRISIQIEEPRCPKCDYLLYGLPSDRCPECGTLIAADGPATPGQVATVPPNRSGSSV